MPSTPNKVTDEECIVNDGETAVNGDAAAPSKTDTPTSTTHSSTVGVDSPAIAKTSNADTPKGHHPTLHPCKDQHHSPCKNQQHQSQEISSPSTATLCTPPALPTSAPLVTSTVSSGGVLKSRRQLVDVIKSAHLPLHTVNINQQHKFWDTQPVPRLADLITPEQFGPVDVEKTPADVRQNPYGLPKEFEWSNCSLKDEKTLKEVYELLYGHYVEDDDNMFRFDYQTEFLQWALLVPGYHVNWHIGVRVKDSQKLVGFITGTPVKLGILDEEIFVAEINFLCVHKKLRSKRLAPVLIKEITRRVNLEGIWQGLYTAGTLLPKPVAECRYHHRALDIKKLIEVKFSFLHERLTMSRALRLYKLPSEVPTPGIRPLAKSDVTSISLLFKEYLRRYKLRPEFQSDEEVEHMFMPRSGVVYSYVKETEGKVTDFFSFYSLPSSVIGNEIHQKLYAAYSFYTIAVTVPLQTLLHSAIILAKNLGFDVFNALDLAENESCLKDLKFGIGDGSLRYYLYNWKMSPIKSSEVHMILV